MSPTGNPEAIKDEADQEKIIVESATVALKEKYKDDVDEVSETVAAQPNEQVTDIGSKVKGLSIDVDASQNVTPTLKDLPSTPPPPEPPSAAEKTYIDPTPKTPVLSRQPSESGKPKDNNVNLRTEEQVTGKKENANENDGDDTSEIQSIMDQFADESEAPTKEEIMSPRHEVPPPHFPPRRSSLEPIRSRDMDTIASPTSVSTSEKFPASPPPVPPKPDTPLKSPQLRRIESSTSIPIQPPPAEPEPDLPFDFHRFLEQLRHKSADPVAKYLRSFLTGFGKKQWMVHEQVKVISDFLAFITGKMAQCDVWRDVSDTEFDNAKEGMEKLVMNRLYSQTFSPAIPPTAQPSRSQSRGRRKEAERITGPGRKGQHQEDVERDEVLSQKIRIYSWVREVHLDIPPVGPNGERFLRLAQQELLKMKGYRAPRDKVICVLNCCKVIFGLLKNDKSSDTSADSFVPLLIYVVLQANPEHLVSNIQYILRFRNQDKLGGEAGYYLSSLSGAIQFIENLDRTSLTVSDDEFERNVELAVSEIAAQNREAEATSPRARIVSEKSTLAEPTLTPRNSMDVTSTSPRRAPRVGTNASTEGSSSEEGAAVAGLLRTIQRPLSTIGRMFSDQDEGEAERRGSSPTASSDKRLTPVFHQPKNSIDDRKGINYPGNLKPELDPSNPSYDAQEAAARQASAEAAEARRIQRAEHRTVVETLCGMFPNLDKEVIDDVVRQKQGRVGLAVDACLALTAGG